MTNRKKIYVDVDTQFDFCDPKGALYVNGAEATLPQTRSLLRHAEKTGALIVGSVDTHNFSAWEFAKNGGPFPPHCLKGRPGWLKMQDTLPADSVFVPNVDAKPDVPKGAGAVYFEKEVYSLFANPVAEKTLESLLEGRGLKKDDVTAIVFGVATDYCVKAAALGLKERGYDVAVVEDAVAAVDANTETEAWQAMTDAGCHRIRTEDVLKESM